MRLSTVRRAHESSPYRRELLILLHTSPLLHAPPPPTHSRPARSLCPLAMGQPLRSPLGHPVSLPPLHRPNLPRLRHAACPFLPPARRSAHGLALQLPAAFHRPATLHPRFPHLAKKPPLSSPHLPAGCDRLCLHSDDVAHRPQPIRHLKKMPCQ